MASFSNIMDLTKSIRKFALANAIKYNGKANPCAILGHIFGENPELKKKAKDVSKEIMKIINEINNLSMEQQKNELEKISPDMLKKKKEEKRDIFKFLGYQPTDKINTAFPPGPEKYPHIGHAKALLLNYMLAKNHNGKFILRFEDTNPKTVKKEFYDIMLENFKWLGVAWDELIYASDYMDIFYDKANFIIKKGLAYVDKSDQDQIKLSREKGIPTKYRDNSIEENIRLWDEMQHGDEGSSILRLKIDLNHKNSTMKDPTIFRIIKKNHVRHKDKYNVWPTYDFQNSIMDSISDIDIRLRSKEFELRAELQRWIQKELGIKITKTYEFGRFNMTGVLSSGRLIREKIQNNELIGWDDPSLTTLVALRRRGFLPEAIKNFVISTGISKAEATLTWDDLIMQNKRLLDNIADRYSAIFDPVELTIMDVPDMRVELHLNPNQKKGGRKMQVTKNFILSKKDVENMQDSEITRLMDCINVIKTKNEVCLDSIKYEQFKGKKIINWLPSKNNVKIEVLMPDKVVKKGIAEQNISKIKEGDVIQFERFGFCRLDKKGDPLKFWFSHK
ncbi:MAG: glutamate--tRNA ligase [Nanoarchaeota archaeon]